MEASAIPDGAWETVSCASIPDGFGLDEARDRCLGAGGDARFELTVENATGGTVAITACTVVPTGPDGVAVAEEPTIVPIRTVHGVPYIATYLGPGDALSMQWFVEGVAPSEDLRYETTCDWTPSAGPVPL